MKNSRIKLSLAARILLIITVIMLTALPILAATYPKPKNNVADEAGVLSESTIRAIQTANKTLELDTGTTIAVCTVDTTGETDIAEYARGVFKEWKLGEGVLLLIAKDDQNYYFVQSVGVESVLTNDVLKSIRDEYLEADFEAGDINRGVNKCVTKLKNVLTAGITSANTSGTTDAANAEPTGTTFGSVVAGFFKAILWIVLIAVVLIVAFFVLAMYNEDAAAMFRKYILRKPDNRRMPEEYYDERLYGDPRRRQSRGRLPQGQNQPRLRAPEDRYSQGGNRYNYNSQPRRSQNSQYGQNQRPRNNAQYNNQGYSRNPNRQKSNPNRDEYSQNYQQNSYSDGSETRAFNIPTHNGQNQGR